MKASADKNRQAIIGPLLWPTRTTAGVELDRDEPALLRATTHIVGHVLRAKVFFDGLLPVGHVAVMVAEGQTKRATLLFFRMNTHAKRIDASLDLSTDADVLGSATSLGADYETAAGHFVVALAQPSATSLVLTTSGGQVVRVTGSDGFFATTEHAGTLAFAPVIANHVLAPAEHFPRQASDAKGIMGFA